MYPAPGYLPFTVKSNGDVGATLTFANTEGVPLDLTETESLLAQVRPVDGSPTVLGSGSATIVDALNGVIALTFEGADFAYLVPSSEAYLASYDLRIILDGVPIVLLEGSFTIRPGVTGI